jgi:hypothetical protein
MLAHQLDYTLFIKPGIEFYRLKWVRVFRLPFESPDPEWQAPIAGNFIGA